MRQVRIGSVEMTVADDQPTFWDRVEAGRWESGTLVALDRFVGPDTVFVDLGAWVGPTALYAAARGALVFAIEADPAALDQLRRNLAANPSLSPRISVVDRAIHAAAGTVTFGARRKPGDSMSSLLLADAATTWRTPTITPAGLASHLPDERPRLIKIDIEGAEYDLLPHLAPLTVAPSIAVLLSLHPKILTEQRALSTAEIATRTRAALAPFHGWSAHAVVATGPIWRTADAAELGTQVALDETDEWLLVRP